MNSVRFWKVLPQFNQRENNVIIQTDEIHVKSELTYKAGKVFTYHIQFLYLHFGLQNPTNIWPLSVKKKNSQE